MNGIIAVLLYIGICTVLIFILIELNTVNDNLRKLIKKERVNHKETE